MYLFTHPQPLRFHTLTFLLRRKIFWYTFLHRKTDYSLFNGTTALNTFPQMQRELKRLLPR